MPIASTRQVKDAKSVADAHDEETEFEKTHRRLQRSPRPAEFDRPSPSGGSGVIERARAGQQQKAASLSPRLVDPASVVQEENVQYQCTDCDMIVKATDPYCPFCGAIFADGTLAHESAAEEEIESPSPRAPSGKQGYLKPERFDIFELMTDRSRSRDLLYQEALKGFAGSARLLEEIEHLISDVGFLGRDISKARRLVGSAWEACREGDWNMVSTLAQQTEELMAPSIPDLVRSELAKAREVLKDAKAAGVDLSQYVLKMKNAMHALNTDDADEALRLTKELLDLLREDSVSWSKGRPAGSRNPFEFHS